MKNTAEDFKQSMPPAPTEPEGKPVAPPAPPKQPKKNRFASFLLVLFLLCVLGGAGYVVWLKTYDVMIDPTRFETTFYSVSNSKIANAIRIIQLSDQHLAEYGENNEDLLADIEALKPDLIAITGDMFWYGKNGYDKVLTLCRGLAAIAPTYYSLGNHELDEIVQNNYPLQAALSETGVIPLHNKTVDITVKDNQIAIGGLSYQKSSIEKYTPNFMADFTSRDGFKLLLTHYPENFIDCLEYEDYDLALTGHAHGGNIRLPIFGPLYSPDQGFLPDLAEGLHWFGNRALIVSRGLGTSTTIPRINNQPELVVVDVNWY